jgi:hypothetical protein
MSLQADGFPVSHLFIHRLQGVLFTDAAQPPGHVVNRSGNIRRTNSFCHEIRSALVHV